jgi:hypothetical protein
MKTKVRRLSKGPGRLYVSADSPDVAALRVYAAVEHCRYTQNARECLAAAKGDVSDLACRMRGLARMWARFARIEYTIMMGRAAV